MKVSEVKGTITLADGTTSEFMIGVDGTSVQWGADRERIGKTVDAVEAMVRGLSEDELLLTQEEVTCSRCGTSIDADEDGMCPYCKSAEEAEDMGLLPRR